MREPFLNCLTTHSPRALKISIFQIFGLFYIISSQVIYIDQILHSYTCYAKLRAILDLFSFFLYTLYIVYIYILPDIKPIIVPDIKRNIVPYIKHIILHSNDAQCRKLPSLSDITTLPSLNIHKNCTRSCKYDG